MSWWFVLLVAAGAAVGAPVRYLTDRAVQARHDSLMPWGTLVVNVVGSFVLGMVAGAANGHHIGDDVVAVAGTGFCGALTTYSTFGYETVRLAEDGAGLLAVANVAANLVAGAVAVVLGYLLGLAW